MRSNNTQGQTYQVLALTQGWQGTTAQLAQLLARRLGQEEAALRSSLEGAQRAQVAQGVAQEQAERLRELLARMGVHAELVAEAQEQEQRPALQKTQMDWHTWSDAARPAPRRPESGDTRVEASATLEELTDAWANVDVQDLPQLLSEAPPAHSPTPVPPQDAQWAHALRPVQTPRPERQNTFDTDFKTLWDRLVPDAAAPEPPTVDLGGDPGAEPGAGWEAILGVSPPAPAHAAPFDRERLTGQWEVVIQTDDAQDSFTLQAPDEVAPAPMTLATPPLRPAPLTPPPARALTPPRRLVTSAPAPPRWRRAALIGLIALLAVAAAAQVGRMLWRASQWGGEDPRAVAAALAERRLQARGAAEVEVSRALYRAGREQEEAKAPNKQDNPVELRRRALQLLGEGRNACATGDFVLCQRLAEEAIALDATNKDAWGLVVKAREQISKPSNNP
jgi:hypothetical protein